MTNLVFLTFLFSGTIFAQEPDTAIKNSSQLFNAPLTSINLSESLVEIVGFQSENSRIELSAIDLYQQLSDAVVRIIVTTRPDAQRADGVEKRAKSIGSGSAVAVTNQLFITSCHVLGKEHQLTERIFFARQLDGKNYPVFFYSGDFNSDRCVLKSSAPLLRPIKKIRSKESIKIGEKVYAIGSPKGFEGAYSDGMLSAIKKNSSGREILLTTAATAKGSSGGALFDSRGYLIGITTAVVTDAPHLSIVIPAQDFFSAPSSTQK